MSTDRGILFKPDLAQAIREGRKTVTRRLDMRLAKLVKGDTLFHKEGLVRGAEPYYHDDDGTVYLAHYATSGDVVWERTGTRHWQCHWRWQRPYLSPLHMPRACAQLRLRLVEDARVESIQRISDADILAEGIEKLAPIRMWTLPGTSILRPTARDAFAAGWDEVHPRFPWRSDPLVVVLRFEVVR